MGRSHTQQLKYHIYALDLCVSVHTYVQAGRLTSLAGWLKLAMYHRDVSASQPFHGTYAFKTSCLRT